MALEDQSLETAVRDLAPGVLRFCLGHCQDPASAEDIAQESLAALVARWRRLGPPEEPAAFTYAIARRRLWRWRVKRRLLAPLSALGELPMREPTPDNGLVSRQRLDRVRNLFGRLTAHERDALLIALDGLSTRQAAAALGVKPTAFKMRLHRARRRLDALLEEDDV